MLASIEAPTIYSYYMQHILYLPTKNEYVAYTMYIKHILSFGLVNLFKIPFTKLFNTQSSLLPA